MRPRRLLLVETAECVGYVLMMPVLGVFLPSS